LYTSSFEQVKRPGGAVSRGGGDLLSSSFADFG
jgi:hypothetical protein